MTAQTTAPSPSREVSDDQTAHARKLRKQAGYEPCDFLCPRCGNHGAYGYKIVDDDHDDEKQRCFLCGFTRYVDGPDA